VRQVGQLPRTKLKLECHIKFLTLLN